MAKLTKRDVESKVQRVQEILGTLEQAKPLYKELDIITMELVDNGILEYSNKYIRMELVDNFTGKNTAFKACGVKRYEIKITPLR